MINIMFATIIRILKIDGVLRTKYIVESLTLIILCQIHEYTKYHTARTLKDLFYWPDGLCMDMAVIGVFFIVALLLVKNAIFICRRLCNERNEV